MLNEVCEINPDTANPAELYPNAHFNYIDISCVENESGKFLGPSKTATDEAPSRARRSVKQGDVLMSTVRPNLKAFTLLTEIPDRAVASTGFAVLRAKPDRLLPGFLINVLRDYRSVDQMVGMAGKGAYPSINQTDVESLQIPLPPLEVQKEIVAEIEGYQKIINGARDVLDHYRPHIPIHPEWPMVELGKVARLINGRAYKQEELLSEGPTPVLRVGNFFSNRSWYYSNLELEEEKYCDEGDLLYAWSASFGPRIWEGPHAIYHYHIWKIETFGEIDKKFLFHLLEADSEKIKSEGNGITMSHATKGGMEQQIPPPAPRHPASHRRRDRSRAGAGRRQPRTDRPLRAKNPGHPRPCVGRGRGNTRAGDIAMNVLQEILEWSQGRPMWQRDALRRLVLNGELSDEDICSLTEICKSAHGLAEQQETDPLAKEHMPDRAAGAVPVSLVSIFHHRGVNALAEDQTLNFAPGLTVVYGDNGAGKTGYIRILKSACRARGQEHILGNVVSGTSPLAPVVAIKYKVGTEPEPREWVGTGGDEFVSRVGVFDTQCAAVYLTEKTDVAFRPFGLDLFDKLVKACKGVRAKLEGEQRALASNALTVVQAQIPEGTAVAKFLVNISSLTKSDAVQALACLSADEEARLALLEKSLLDLQANDPEKLIKQLTLRVGRLQTLVRHLKDVEAALSADAVAAVFNARTEGRRKGEEAKRLREATFPEGMLAGTGSEPWKALWESARQFSQGLAYPGKAFPVVEDGAHCVLCQQDLEHAAVHRLKQFEAFVASTTERELRRIRENFARLRKAFTELRTTTEAVEETLKEIRIEYEAIADSIAAALAANESRRTAVVAALADDKDLAADSPDLVSIVRETETLSGEVVARIKTLRTSA
ncbi:MAG: restriction endonuclease subunit S, partial [Nitrospira sp.]